MEQSPNLAHLEDSVKLGDPKVTEGLGSRYKSEFPVHEVSSHEEHDYRSHGAASVSLADGTGTVERESAARSTYKDHGPVEQAQQSHTTAELLKSHVFVEDARAQTPQSTNKSQFVAHPTVDVQPIPPPKTKLDLSQPLVDLKDTFKTSYQDTHRGEVPADDSAPVVPRNTFQSTFTLDEGLPSEPLVSTSKKSFTTPVVTEADTQPALDPGRNTRTSISLGNAPADHATTASTHYARPPQEAIVNSSPTKPTRNLAHDSNVNMRDNETKKTPTPTSREAYSSRPGTASPSSPKMSRARPTDNSILGTTKEPATYNTTSSATFQRPQTSPNASSPSRGTRDMQKSSFQLSSPDASPKITSTARSTYTAPPDSPSSTTSPSSPSYARKGRSHFSLGTDTTTYQSTSRSMYSSPPATPSSPSSPARRMRADQISNVVLGDASTFSMGSPSHTSSSRAVYTPHSPTPPSRPSDPQKSHFTLG